MNKQPDAIHYTEAGAAAVGAELEREVLKRELARAMKVVDAARAVVRRADIAAIVDLKNAVLQWADGN